MKNDNEAMNANDGEEGKSDVENADDKVWTVMKWKSKSVKTIYIVMIHLILKTEKLKIRKITAMGVMKVVVITRVLMTTLIKMVKNRNSYVYLNI